AALVRLFGESVSAVRCSMTVKGKKEQLSVQQTISYLHDPDRNVRKAAAAALTKQLKGNARLLTFLLNTVVQDHRADCDLRHYRAALTERNLHNEITDDSVAALMTVVEEHYPTVQRYYRLKGQLLGLKQLFDYDRYAPLFPDLPECDWKTARKTVTES